MGRVYVAVRVGSGSGVVVSGVVGVDGSIGFKMMVVVAVGLMMVVVIIVVGEEQALSAKMDTIRTNK